MIASGVYIIKFLITDSSWKNIAKKYKKSKKKILKMIIMIKQKMRK